MGELQETLAPGRGPVRELAIDGRWAVDRIHEWSDDPAANSPQGEVAGLPMESKGEYVVLVKSLERLGGGVTLVTLRGPEEREGLASQLEEFTGRGSEFLGTDEARVEATLGFIRGPAPTGCHAGGRDGLSAVPIAAYQARANGTPILTRGGVVGILLCASGGDGSYSHALAQPGTARDLAASVRGGGVHFPLSLHEAAKAKLGVTPE
jgi:hypothetical protein